MTKKTHAKPTKKQNTPSKERVLTREEFFRVLDKVIQPLPVGSKVKPIKKEKKGTSG